MVNDFYQSLKSFDRLNTCIYFKKFNKDKISSVCLQYSNLLIVQYFCTILHWSRFLVPAMMRRCGMRDTIVYLPQKDTSEKKVVLQNWQIFGTNWMDTGYACCTPLWFDRYRNLIFKTIVITILNEMEYFALYGVFFKFTTLKRYTY